MYFSTRSALAALLVAGDALVQACPPRFPKPHTGGVPVPSSAAAAGTGGTGVPYPSYTWRPTPSASAAATTTATATATVSPIETTPVEATPSATYVPATTLSTTTTAAPAASATASSGGSGASALSADQSGALSTQNDARSEVSESALTWSASLAADAQSWAEHLASLGSPGELVHSSGTGQGENLYWQSDSGTPYANAATSWVNEKSLYSGEAIEEGSAFESYGHYTQIIWKTTTQVGMGIASDGSGGYYVVARYTPEGNVIGETPTSS